MTSTQNPQALLEQTGWIHALARRLVADPHLAADLAQETCMDAIERQPDSLRPLRGWLAKVMRNNLAKLRRGEGNRAAREQAVRRAELAPSAHDVVEKAESHRNVVLAVLALDEPYRSTLLMRFFEQLSYAEIARRTGSTRAGVNSRVTRGLELLRARLETTYGGDRRALHLALIPLAKLPTGVAATLLGVKTMHLAIGSAAAAALAVTVSIGVTSGGREAREPAVLPVAVPGRTTEPAGNELRRPEEIEVPAESARVELAPQEKEKAKKKEKQDDTNVWKTELFDARVLPETVTSLAVNTGSGDIEVLESLSGRLEILAKVRARLGKVKDEELTQIFTDHVDVFEEDGELHIEDAHEGNGWTVSFVVHAPGRLPLDANTGSGDIVVRRASGKLGVNTGSGDVRVELAMERVKKLEANTGSGDVVVEVAAIEGKLEANTGSGDVTFRVAEPDSPGAAGLNSGSGDVLLIVPPAVSGSFDLETHGDGIILPRSFGIAVETDVSGRHKAKGSVGSGGGKYVARSGSGELVVELGNALPAEPK